MLSSQNISDLIYVYVYHQLNFKKADAPSGNQVEKKKDRENITCKCRKNILNYRTGEDGQCNCKRSFHINLYKLL